MIDLQIIEIRDILSVTSVQEAHGVTPRTLLLKGANFRNAFEVWINEAKSPSVVIASATSLLAQVPTAYENSPIRNVVVVSSTLTNVGRSKIEFRLGDTPHLVSGIEKLVQAFLKILLQTPGSDAFARKIGGGLLNAAGRLAGKSTATANTVASDVHLAVARTQQQLLAMQANDSTLALSEKLLYAKLREASFLRNELALVARIEIANQAQRAALVNLET